MIIQKEISLNPKPRGIHLISSDIIKNIPELKNIKRGLANIFIKHTSAALALNENADPDVRKDLQIYLDRIVPEDKTAYYHIDEGVDDMPAHIKSVIVGSSINLPISEGRFNIGIWQGIYLCEFRNNGGSRKLAITIIAE